MPDVSRRPTSAPSLIYLSSSWQADAELHAGRAGDGALRRSAVGLGDGAHDGEPEAGAAAIGARGHEAAEEAFLHVLADLAFVAHREHDLIAPAADLDLD